MNTEKPMNTDAPQPPDGGDGRFERHLGRLYQSALLDEDFQQLMANDLQALPEAGKALLEKREQAFANDGELPSSLAGRLLGMMEEPVAAKKQAGDCPPWWKKLFGGGGWEHFFLTGPMVSIPVASLGGLVVGVLVTTVFIHGMQPPDLVMQGGADDAKQKPAAQKAGLSDSDRQDPDTWAAAIVDLQCQGKWGEAASESRSFNNRFPGHRLKPMAVCKGDPSP